MESVAELLKWVLENLNYWVVTIFMAIESSFIPFPSEAVVPPAAWKAMADDSMNIFLVIVFATVGADIGALVNYYLARWLGVPLFTNLLTAVWGICVLSMKKKCTMPKNISENTVRPPLSSDVSSLLYVSLSVFLLDWPA